METEGIHMFVSVCINWDRTVQLPKKQSILLTSNYTLVHYITVLSCLGLCTWAACLIMFKFTPVLKLILRLEAENIQLSTYSVLWGQGVPPIMWVSVPTICLLMPHIVTVYSDFATRILLRILRGLFLLSLQFFSLIWTLCIQKTPLGNFSNQKHCY